uniref:Uncharacterized protein n=1 Tax=Timema poppense TaxID=170557 RepID=A0A7R9HE76_TIMPO|nr:unnamed protein product [Timema poppensis]
MCDTHALLNAVGIPKMQVPPAEPFVLPALQIDRDLDSLKIKAHLENIQAFGGSAFVVDKLSVDPHKLTLAMTVTVPSLYVVTDYDVNGRLLLVPLRGKGVFKGNFSE